MWECVPLLDEATSRWSRELGGVAAIADLAPALLLDDGRVEPRLRRRPDLAARADRAWVMRPDRRDPLLGGRDERCPRADADPRRRPLRRLELLHWPAGADGRGVFCRPDMPMVAMGIGGGSA